MLEWLTLAGGFVLLILGGEALVRGSVAVAERAGMSPLLIGLTLVGFGTSMPELVTSVQAAWAGAPGIALGNVVGSNISNILLILGLSAIVTPIAVVPRALRRDGVFVLLTALLLFAVAHLLPLGRAVGAGFLVLLALYLWYAYRQERADGVAGHTAAYEKAEAYEEIHTGPVLQPAETRRWVARLGPVMPFVLAISGLVIIVLGGKLLVDGAVGIARTLGVSDTIIGLTIVAIGTSAPELVTSLIAAFRKHADVALGNIMGSCIYNVLGIAGATGLMAPTVFPPEIVAFDSYVMVAAALALIVFALNDLRIHRWEGGLLVLGYVAYIYALWPR